MFDWERVGDRYAKAIQKVLWRFVCFYYILKIAKKAK